MSRRECTACLLAGIISLGAFPLPLPRGVAASAPEVGAPAPHLPAPQWVGGIDVRGKARLTWVRSPAFAAVRIYRRDEGRAVVFRLLGETPENSWIDETVEPGRSYRYRLAGVGPDGREGRPSSELAVHIGVVALRAPAAPQWEGYLVVDDGVGLKWSAREGEDVIAWNVFRKSPPDTQYRLIGSTRGTSYHDAGLEPDRLYVYVLTALDSNFGETPFSNELPVRFARPRAPDEAQRPTAWKVRRTRLIAHVAGGKDLPFVRPADVAVGFPSGTVYVADSGRNLVFVFSPNGIFQRTLGSGGGEGAFQNLLGLATDREENLYAVDAGAGAVQVFTRQGLARRRMELPRRAAGPTGLIDAAVGPDGRIYLVDNFNNNVTISARGGFKSFGRAGADAGEFSAPTFCAIDTAGSFIVSDCLNGRVQVFTGTGEFVRAFGRTERGPGGFGRPKGVAVTPAGEIYVADSWLNTVQVFDALGRFIAVLGDENGRPLDLGSPNGVALGPGNRIYVAERLSSRLQIRELIDVD